MSEKQAGLGAGGICVHVGGGAGNGDKATPNLSQRSYSPRTVTCMGAEDEGTGGPEWAG